MKDDEEFEDLMQNQSNTIRRLKLDGRREPQRGEEREISPRWEEEEIEEAELTVDLYQTNSEIIVQTMVAGVQPDNLSITINRDTVTIKGNREENQSIGG